MLILFNLDLIIPFLSTCNRPESNMKAGQTVFKLSENDSFTDGNITKQGNDS